jgi:integrase
MGKIFRPKYKDRNGVIRESAVWWIRFRQHGKTERQSTETTSETKARTFLREREGKVALNVTVNVKAERLTLSDAAGLIRHDYQANGRKSAATIEYRLAHLLAYFGESTRLARLTTGAVEAYRVARLRAKAAPGTVNREVQALGRMASLAHHQYGLAVPFARAMFVERNARQGFFEPAAFEAVCQRLRPELAALARAAYLTGWRKSELRSRQWGHVDFAAGWIRLEKEETKNREGRQFPLIPQLRDLLEAQRGRVKEIEKKTEQIVPWIFCRDDGAPVGDFKKAWATACIDAGFFQVVPVGTPKESEPQKTRKVPTRIFHDFRRTAVRNLERAGVSRSAAMKITGHKTESVYRRYAIVDESDLREAGIKLAALQGSKVGAVNGKVVSLER